MPRIRRSLQEIQAKYDSGEDKSELENLVRAFRGIQELDPSNPNSFFTIGGYHGLPFREEQPVDDPDDWWGGYCNHGNVLFPTWHRAYLYNLEEALRSIPGCENVTLPFWDECLDYKTDTPIPSILTSPTFSLDGNDYNPFYSYKLQEKLVHQVKGQNERYSKPVGYETVRYPQSGLVGNDEDKHATEIHNATYNDPVANAQLLNANVANWLSGTVEITPDGDDTHDDSRMPDTYSVYSRFKLCLRAPDYTIFSNKTSQDNWIRENGGDPDKDHYVVCLESPHNAIHLAVGGFYQKGQYNADNIPGANGDMGDNETAGFDPIFYFHHCFIDYVFWTWQKYHGSTKLLVIDPNAPGSKSGEALPNIPLGTPLDINTPLYPFKKADGTLFTSADVTNIAEQLGYEYGVGSLDIRYPEPSFGTPDTVSIVKIKRIHNINRAQYPGSFVIRTFAIDSSGRKVEIGRDAILSRWNTAGCANCQDKLNAESYVPIDAIMLGALQGKDGANADIQYGGKPGNSSLTSRLAIISYGYNWLT
ncbi:putative tyrosinase [Xylogone sp. PMI_703]|nr:putative tyrosinase [Xylogone sp. PMI_703]